MDFSMKAVSDFELETHCQTLATLSSLTMKLRLNILTVQYLKSAK